MIFSYIFRRMVWILSALSVVIVAFHPFDSQAAQQGETSEAGSAFVPIVANNHSTGPGILKGVVTDAINNRPINGAVVCLNPKRCYVTNEDGAYTFANVPSGEREVETRRDGYLALTLDVLIRGGMENNLDFALSPSLAVGEYRVVLTWAESPKDLDTHFWLPYPNYPHLYLDYPGSCSVFPNTCLDRDDRNGYGPETVSIKRLADHGTYAYAVLNYDYSHPGVPDLTASGARVQVYSYEGLIANFRVPLTGNGDLWYVFRLNASNGEIVPVNCITYYPSDPDRPDCNAMFRASSTRYQK